MNKLEKQFKNLFILCIGLSLIQIFFEILSITTLPSYNISITNAIELCTNIILGILSFICIKQLKNNNKNIGYYGIIIGILLILLGDLFSKLIGVSLLYYSIMYLNSFKEN